MTRPWPMNSWNVRGGRAIDVSLLCDWWRCVLLSPPVVFCLGEQSKGKAPGMGYGTDGRARNRAMQCCDVSAIVPYCLDEPWTPWLIQILAEDALLRVRS